MAAILALDIGDKRIGVARAHVLARLPEPLTTLSTKEQWLDSLKEIIDQEEVDLLVVGLPRNQSGAETQQTKKVLQISAQLEQLGLPIAYQDESLTSVAAERRLRQRGRPYQKADIDQLAAVLILEDYLRSV